MAEKKKLMLLSPMLHQGGFERVCVTTARLMEPYFDVTIVIFDSSNMAYDVTGLKIIDIRMGVKKGKLRKLFNIARRSIKVRKLKKDLKPDIAYSFGPTANMVNAFSRAGEQVWLGLRNYTDVEETLKIRIFTLLADRIICCSREIERELKNKFRYNKTAVLYNLYDVPAIRREADAKEPDLPWKEEKQSLRYLISMGRDDDMKGFWHMLKVFSLVHERIPESRLILLGAGSFSHYRLLAEELKIADAIHFAGMQKEPYQYLKKGEVYLLTSLNEGFPNALVEGMALGLAPVSANCLTGPAEILVEGGDSLSLERWFDARKSAGKAPVKYGEYGILVPAMARERNLDAGCILEEERNMAQAVVTLMNDSRELLRYQKAAERRAEEFTYETYAERFLDLAQSL